MGCDESGPIAMARPLPSTVTSALHASGQSWVHVTRTVVSVTRPSPLAGANRPLDVDAAPGSWQTGRRGCMRTRRDVRRHAHYISNGVTHSERWSVETPCDGKVLKCAPSVSRHP